MPAKTSRVFQMKFFMLTVLLLFSANSWSECVTCHIDIEPDAKASAKQSQTMKLRLKTMGEKYGDPEGCVICHGGNPKAKTIPEAHIGKPKNMLNGPEHFYPDPGNIQIANKTCGQCHASHVYKLGRTLMDSKSDKYQDHLHSKGIILWDF